MGRITENTKKNKKNFSIDDDPKVKEMYSLLEKWSLDIDNEYDSLDLLINDLCDKMWVRKTQNIRFFVTLTNICKCLDWKTTRRQLTTRFSGRNLEVESVKRYFREAVEQLLNNVMNNPYYRNQVLGGWKDEQI